MLQSLKVIAVICQMDMARLMRQKALVIGPLMIPASIFVIVGSGAGAMSGLGVRYVQFIFPGVIALSLSFTASLAATRFLWDRKHGFLRVCFLAPVSRSTVFVAKMASGSLLSLAQGAVLLAFLPALGVRPDVSGILSLLGLILLLSVAFNAIGLALASVIETPETLQGLSLGLKVPLTQLTTAFVPLASYKGVLGWVVAYNPVTYGLDAMKHVILVPEPRSRLHTDFPWTVDALSMGAFALACVAVAWWVFRYRD